jgi:hypothetical protein
MLLEWFRFGIFRLPSAGLQPLKPLFGNNLSVSRPLPASWRNAGDCLPVSLMMAFSGGRFGAGRLGLALQKALRKNSKVVASVPAVKQNLFPNLPQ